MSEICTPPIIGTDENGDETVTFTADHTWGDFVRWIWESEYDAREVAALLKYKLKVPDSESP